MFRIRTVLVAIGVLALGGGAVASAGTGGGGDRDGDHRRGDHGGWGHHGKHDGWGHHGKRGRTARATLIGADGEPVGRVLLREHRGAVAVFARVRGLEPGFHGFHIHTTGVCDPDAGFTTAGGHFNPTGATHGAHAGDLPSLLVMEDGTAMLATATDRFAIADLRDADGSAVMVHSGADNFANIPPRYGTPDAETQNTGDAGSRVACGVVR